MHDHPVIEKSLIDWIVIPLDNNPSKVAGGDKSLVFTSKVISQVNSALV